MNLITFNFSSEGGFAFGGITSALRAEIDFGYKSYNI